MPRIFTYGPYVFFIWANEEGEPVHVHVAIKRPTQNATKFWLTSNGGCILANNTGQIPEKSLRDLAKIIRFNHRRICDAWMELNGEDSLRFYC